MPAVYVFQEGKSFVFKIGRTGSEDVEPRRKQLNSGSSQGLFLFAVGERDSECVCERFFHRLLQTRRVMRGGGGEFFEMDSEDHMRETIEQFRDMQSRLEKARLAVAALEKIESTQQILDSTASDVELMSQLRMLDARLLELKQEMEYVNFERELIVSELKARIGNSLGINGVATWETTIRRNFSEALLRDRDPDLYNQLLSRFTKLDTTAWAKQQPGHYKKVHALCFVPAYSRNFKLVIPD